MKTLSYHIEWERKIRAERKQNAFLEVLQAEEENITNLKWAHDGKGVFDLVFGNEKHPATKMTITSTNEGYMPNDEDVTEAMDLEDLMKYLAKWYLDIEETYP